MDRDAGQIVPSRCFAECEREQLQQQVKAWQQQSNQHYMRVCHLEKRECDLEQQLSTLQQGIDYIAKLDPRIHHIVDAIRIARDTNRKLKEQDNG